MADAYIQVPVDQGGKKVETTEFTRYDGAVVERQRMEIPGAVTVRSDDIAQILTEMKLNNLLLASAFNIPDDLDKLRDDINRN